MLEIKSTTTLPRENTPSDLEAGKKIYTKADNDVAQLLEPWCHKLGIP